MANELEVAEELSNSSPEQAMELLSSIGKTLLNKRYVIVTLFFSKILFSGHSILSVPKSFRHE